MSKDECTWDSRPKFDLLIGPVRAKARELGYAIGVHGSLVRDIDLIACPWTAEAVDARTLAEALREVIREANDGVACLGWKLGDPEATLNGCPGDKPHGRRCWSYYLGDGPWVDLSVMPRAMDAALARVDGRAIEGEGGDRS